jgi:hypothetical protein
MKAIWPGQPGGYVPTAWISLVREAQIKENARNMHKKQSFYSNVKDAQEAAKKGKKR